jgi:YVTN family beta-propeller protein
VVLLKGASAVGYYSATGKLVASVPVGQHPHEMVLSRDGKLLYVTDNGTMRMEHAGEGGNTVSIVDLAARRRIGVIELGEHRRPHGIAIDPRTGQLLVTSERTDKLLLLDPTKRRVIRAWDTGGRQPHMVTAGADGKYAWVSNTGAGTVSAIRLEEGERKLIQVEARPQGSVLSRDGRELYVVCTGAAGINVIDTSRLQLLAHIPTGKGPNRIAITPDGNTLVYSMSAENKVAFGNGKTRTQNDYVLLPNPPLSCTLSKDGATAFASAEAQDTVYLISVKERKITGEIRTEKGAAPDPVLEIG